MNVVLYGASGMVGSRLLKELVSRGHQVTEKDGTFLPFFSVWG